MASWPWMKGCSTGGLVQPPAEAAVDKDGKDDDDRPLVHQLIDQHRPLIDQVKVALSKEPLYDGENKHDDLWIVRFLLSHKGKVKAAIKAAQFTLAFRKEHGLDDSDLRAFPPRVDCPQLPAAARRFLQHCADGTFAYGIFDSEPQHDGHHRGHVIGIVQLAGIHQADAVQHVTEADWLACFLYITEWSHQCLDYVTRTTGRLTKSIRIVDVEHLQLRHVHQEAVKRFGKIMHVMEDCYPQLLQGLFVVHAPSYVMGPWRLLRPLMPKRVVTKFDFVSPQTNQGERQRLLKYMSLKDLPERYGGENSVWPVEFTPAFQT